MYKEAISLFKKVLIANRGEIAARIQRSCQEQGIETVVVYSEPDQEMPYVSQANESYALHGSKVNESYLDIDKIIHIAKEAGVDAIHPGYGLLSENTTFANRCEQENIRFIGPSSKVISQMGDKIAARQAMEHANVPIVPGNTTALADVEEAIIVANDIGYPVMLKAAAGGGGIGMQAVDTDEALRKAFDSNSTRAQNFFGNGTMFIEKLIQKPRHIEIQVAVDRQGQAVYIGERECSIQRRHQKVVEEATSSFIDEQTRQKMGEAAVKAALSIGYENIGTIEFLVDEHKNYYFLEMNTRLQVEHPVTEEVSGIDLVALQLRLADGQALPFTQQDISLANHAIEVRIYAEDPKTFFPSPGTISTLRLPEGQGIRHELAIIEGSTISPYYDPMIGKLIVTAPTRLEAIERLKQALESYVIEGIKTNIPILREIIQHPAFIAGDTTTDFIETHMQHVKV